MEEDKGIKQKAPKYKGKFIKKKNLERKLKVLASIAEAKKQRHERAEEEKPVTPVIEGKNENLPDNNVLVGNRIFDMKVFAESMKCCKCKQVLSLRQAKSERRIGLYSTFNVQCLQCNFITEVSTGTVQIPEDRRKARVPDINKKAVLGSINAGVPRSSLNKFLTSLEIPNLSSTIYKRYEDEINPANGKASEESSEVLDKDGEP